MKTLKRKILVPMVLLIVLVPMATLLFFNIIVRIYVQKTAQDDLKNAMLPIETLARQELMDRTGALTQSRLEKAALKLTDAVRASKLTGARLLIYDKNRELVYPQNLPDGFVSTELSKKIAARLKSPGFSGKAVKIKADQTSCLMTGYVLSGLSGSRVILVLASRQGTTGSLIRIINLILLMIMLVGIGVGVLLVSRISDRISRHVGQIRAAADRIGQGDFSHPAWSKTDILEFRELSRSIARMSDRLEASEQSQRDFLQNASHELRTPLMSIQGYAEGISNGIVPDIREAADIIERESCRLNKLVEELLTLTKIESRTFIRKPVPLNLCNLMPEFVQRLGGIAMKQNKEIALSLPQYPVTVLGDENLLAQAVSNILSNGLRYANAQVSVRLLCDKNSVIIRSQDDGPGIPEADLPHLFERFYKGRGGNFGLGLAIAKSSVRYLGGEIKAYNGEKGTVFDIILRQYHA